MKAVIHVLVDEIEETKFENLFKNKNIFEYDVKHFLITNHKNINKTIFSGFEQILYFNRKNELKSSIKNLIEFLTLLNYNELVILTTNDVYKENEIFFSKLEDLYRQFTVIDNIINI
jgi:hypothetical protein